VGSPAGILSAAGERVTGIIQNKADNPPISESSAVYPSFFSDFLEKTQKNAQIPLTRQQKPCIVRFTSFLL
jgi:hypothetical protein